MSQKFSLRVKQIMAILALVGILLGVIGTAWVGTTVPATQTPDITINP